MTSVPKPLKFLRPHYDALKARLEGMPAGAPNRQELADVVRWGEGGRRLANAAGWVKRCTVYVHYKGAGQEQQRLSWRACTSLSPSNGPVAAPGVGAGNDEQPGGQPRDAQVQAAGGAGGRQQVGP
jgi:hypothetical protein